MVTDFWHGIAKESFPSALSLHGFRPRRNYSPSRAREVVQLLRGGFTKRSTRTLNYKAAELPIAYEVGRDE